MMIIQIYYVLFVAPFVSSIPARCLMLASPKESEECSKATKSRNIMHKHNLTDNEAKCNDGSAAGYYLRRSKSSTLWIVYLEGGWFCFEKMSCLRRMEQSNMYSMTSSKLWKEKRHGDGLLNPDDKKNPQFWDVNHVYVPYCSSDFWTGNGSRTTKSGAKIIFHGSHIIISVIKDLLNKGLRKSSKLILAGSSAGGIGVLQNVDRVLDYLEEKKLTIDVRGLVDSAWFLDSGVSINCHSSNDYDCHPQLMFKAALRYWKGVVHSSCELTMKSERHKCLFAFNIFPTLRTPVFVAQWLYDTVQILADNKDLELNPQHMFNTNYISYIKNLGHRMKKSLKEINGKHGIFAPACISHTALATTTLLKDFTLHSSTLNKALHCWLSKNTRNQRSPCKQRIIDKCESMQFCHHNCPAIQDPLTGKELELSVTGEPIDYAKSNLGLLNRFLHDLKEGH